MMLSMTATTIDDFGGAIVEHAEEAKILPLHPRLSRRTPPPRRESEVLYSSSTWLLLRRPGKARKEGREEGCGQEGD